RSTAPRPVPRDLLGSRLAPARGGERVFYLDEPVVAAPPDERVGLAPGLGHYVEPRAPEAPPPLAQRRVIVVLSHRPHGGGGAPLPSSVDARASARSQANAMMTSHSAAVSGSGSSRRRRARRSIASFASRSARRSTTVGRLGFRSGRHHGDAGGGEMADEMVHRAHRRAARRATPLVVKADADAAHRAECT